LTHLSVGNLTIINHLGIDPSITCAQPTMAIGRVNYACSRLHKLVKFKLVYLGNIATPHSKETSASAFFKGIYWKAIYSYSY